MDVDPEKTPSDPRGPMKVNLHSQEFPINLQSFSQFARGVCKLILMLLTADPAGLTTPHKKTPPCRWGLGIRDTRLPTGTVVVFRGVNPVINGEFFRNHFDGTLNFLHVILIIFSSTEKESSRGGK